jgi:hypothetical protein
MNRISGFIGAALLVALMAQPAAAQVLVATYWGYADAPEFAAPAMYVDVFLTHENGKVYGVKTGSIGVTLAEIPPGLITNCQAWQEARHLDSWPCIIPVGKESFEKLLRGGARKSGKGPVAPTDGFRGLLAANLSLLQGTPDALCDGCALGWDPSGSHRVLLAQAPSGSGTAGTNPPPSVVDDIVPWTPGVGRLVPQGPDTAGTNPPPLVPQGTSSSRAAICGIRPVLSSAAGDRETGGPDTCDECPFINDAGEKAGACVILFSPSNNRVAVSYPLKGTPEKSSGNVGEVHAAFVGIVSEEQVRLDKHVVEVYIAPYIALDAGPSTDTGTDASTD